MTAERCGQSSAGGNNGAGVYRRCGVLFSSVRCAFLVGAVCFSRRCGVLFSSVRA